MAEDLVSKAIREAEEACQLAIASTPEPYRGFITLISQNKRAGGSRQSPQYATIRLPYMTVDGRIKMARDEHRQAGFNLTIQTTFEPIGDYMVCKAVVTSTMLGTAVGHAVVNFGGSGVDASNPIENGESSAIGRALGALGYGLYGTGVASAEEVLSAMSQQARQKAEATRAPDAFVPGPVQQHRIVDYGATSPHEPASVKQMGLLYAKLKECGVRDGHKRQFIDFAYSTGLSRQVAREIIDFTDTEQSLPSEMKRSYIKFLVHEYNLDRKVVAQHMDRTCEHHDPADLTQEQFLALVEYLIPKEQPEPKPEPDDIYLPGEATESVTREEWTKFGVSLCMAEKLNNNQFEAWAIANFGNGTEENIAKLSREAYNSLVLMDTGDIAKEVKAFDQNQETQEALLH